MSLPLITADTTRRLDQETMQQHGVSGSELMNCAGTGLARVAESYLRKMSRVVSVVGIGNNGGDGIVAARELARNGHLVAMLWMGAREKLLPGPRRELEALRDFSITHCTLADDWRALLHDAELILDAMFGVGLARKVVDPFASVITHINSCRVPVIAADIPSGLCADTGRVLGAAIRATATTTFGLPKLGLVDAEGPAHIGRLHVIPIPWAPSLIDALPREVALLETSDITPHLPRRTHEWHKGRSGHAMIIAGASHAPGAGNLASRACLRAGAGLVTYALPAAVRGFFSSDTAEIMLAPIAECASENYMLPGDAMTTSTSSDIFSPRAITAVCERLIGKSALGIGPGIGTAPATCEFFAALLPHLKLPTVIDADALNIIAKHPKLFSQLAKHECVLTPHPGEMARMMACSVATIQHNRLATARDFAMAHHTHVLLKGACSVLARPDGTVRVNPTGASTLATAGSGDVLTGLITGLLAQGVSIAHAAEIAVYLHGLAGEYCAHNIGAIGVLASDIADTVPTIYTSLRGATAPGVGLHVYDEAISYSEEIASS